jgi:hypothetical protein
MSEATTNPTMWEPPTATRNAVAEQKALATSRWTTWACAHGFTANTLANWTVTHTPTGEPVLSARVTGPRAAEALKGFTIDGRICYPGSVHDSGVRPQADYDTPGRVQCVWNYGGVWVQLWRPDGARPTPAVLAALAPGRRTLWQRFSPSGRLTYTRTAKGNRTS